MKMYEQKNQTDAWPPPTPAQIPSTREGSGGNTAPPTMAHRPSTGGTSLLCWPASMFSAARMAMAMMPKIRIISA
eukprot:8807231-Lingulodinium_polyedra.AAC.2